MTVALIDCNSFFCSCERLFNPQWEKKPLVVLSHQDGCVVSATREAKRLGISIGVPYFQIKDLFQLHGGVAISSNFALYADLSARVMQTLSQRSSHIEIYSVDEAFLDFSGLSIEEQFEQGRLLTSVVKQHVGIPTSIGIAPTKVLAKLANHLAKTMNQEDGVFQLVDEKKISEWLEQIPVEDIWGIGKKSAQKLRLIGIGTAKEFRDETREALIQKLLTKVGRQIQDELRGIPCLSLRESFEAKKQIAHARLFPQSFTHKQDVEALLCRYVSRAAEKLRSQQSVCSMISIYIRTDYHKEDPQYQGYECTHLGGSTSDTKKLVKVTMDMLKKIFRPGYTYKKGGVILSQISSKSEHQLSLFGPEDSYEDDQLMKVMDSMNKKEGRETLQLAACGTRKEWGASGDASLFYRSPYYTTKWEDLLKVR
jgi:DNA polymerase V